MTTDPDSMPTVEIHVSDDWAGLYLNGHLEYTNHPGDVYEYTLNHLGVAIINDNAFMQGGNGVARNGRPGPARTLAEVEAHRVDRDARMKIKPTTSP